MTTSQIIGAFLVALPFIAVFIFITRMEGLLEAVLMFVGVVTVVALLYFGTLLLVGEL